MLIIFCMNFFQSILIADVYTCTLYITLLSLSASCTYDNLTKTLQVKTTLNSCTDYILLVLRLKQVLQ